MSFLTLNELIEKMGKKNFMRTKRGLLFALVFIFWASWNLFKVFLPLKFAILSSSILMLIYCIYWLFFSCRLFLPAKMNILFAIDVGSVSNGYLDQIKKEITEKIDNLNLSKKIKIIDLPEDLSFATRKEAETYAKNHSVDLLVWGYQIEGKEDGNDISEFRLKFTYVFSYRSVGVLHKALSKHVQAHVDGRYWKIIGKSSLLDIKVVSSNIIEVSLFIIGISMHLRGNINTSIEIFEKLLHMLMKKNDGSKVFAKMLGSVTRYLIEAYRFKGETLRDENMEESKECYEKVLQLDADDSGAHLVIAKLCYLIDDDIEKAKYHTDKVTAPMLKPLTYYNKAFFAIKEHNCSDVLKYYQKIKTNPSQNIVDIIDFLQKEFTKDIDNILFFFGLGYINVYHLDVAKGINQLTLFIEKATDAQYQELAGNARRLLENRKKKSTIANKG